MSDDQNQNQSPPEPSEDFPAHLMNEPAEASPATEPTQEQKSPESDAQNKTVDTDKKLEQMGKYQRLRQLLSLRLDGKDLHTAGLADFDRPPLSPREGDPDHIPLMMPMASQAKLNASVENILSIDFANDVDAANWFAIHEQAMPLLMQNDVGLGALNREGSNWIQSPKYNNSLLVPSVKKRPEMSNQELNMRSATYYAMAALGLGIPSKTPLWASGWWVSFRPATDEEWVALQDRMAYNKAEGMRAVSGLAYTNSNSLYLDMVLDFVIEHIFETNIRFENSSPDGRQNYRRLLKTTDIPAFITGFMAACYPSGYPITRGCTADIGKCTAEIKETVQLQRLLIVDKDRLEERHLAHMARNGSAMVTEKEILEYQEQILPNQAFEYTLVDTGNTTVRVKLAVPTAEEQLLAGKRWIASIASLIDTVLAKDASDNTRRQAFQQYSKSTQLREYSHWIREVYLDSNVVKGVDNIEKLMNITTAHNKMRESLYETIEKYIEQSTFSLIALPMYDCPVCKKPQIQRETNDPLASCIPIDVLHAFFSLARLRVFEISQR